MDRPLPFHLRGNYAPVADETTAVDLPVVGRLPEALDGVFLRNGANPHTGASPHWFFGDGMVHGMRIADGRAQWYRNRYVRTTRFDGATKFGADGSLDLAASAANTHVIAHAGRILALEETSLPYQLDAELSTVGPYDFDGALTTGMTAHPKICPSTGEMHFFAYGFVPPYLTYWVADASGRIVTRREIDVPGATMMHDMNLSERFVVFMDLPLVFDLELAMQGTMPYRFDRDYGARLGVLRRDDPHGAVRWFDVDPCYVFHPINAHDDGHTITIDVVRYAELWTRPGEASPAVPWRWRVDLDRGSVDEHQLDDRACEFPRIDDRLTGQHASWAWATRSTRDDHSDGALLGIDLDTGRTVEHRFGAGRIPGQGVFAPADAHQGGPGYVMTFVYDTANDRSEFVVLDAAGFDDEPVARVPLPVRVPYGFHGSWVPTDALPVR